MRAVKLTNYLRDAFVRQVMADVPKIDYTELLRKALMKAAADKLPPKVAATWKDPALKVFINTSYANVAGQSVHIPRPESGFENWRTEVETDTAVLALAEKHTAQKQHLADLESKVHSVAYGVTTRKALADALPEFAKYLPPDEAAAIRSLPVVANVVADFVKAGWPKGGKKSWLSGITCGNDHDRTS